MLLTKTLSLIAVMAVMAAPQEQPPRVPESIVFAGETYRFDRPDLYERMDRELIAFTYSHTLSTLMLKRADRIFSQVVPILKRNGVPEDLKYLIDLAHRSGIGSALYAELEKRLRAQGIINLCASITAEAEPSIRFHTKHGYTKVAHFHKCGRKFNQWLDMIWMEKFIAEHEE